MWDNVSRNLASILSDELFPALFSTRPYTEILRKGGMKEPFAAYIGRPLPKTLHETWAVYARLIADELRSKGALEPGSVVATVVPKRGSSLKLFRLMHAHNSRPDHKDLRRGSADIGDWWFERALLDECKRRCAALEQERKKNPLLTDTSEAKCVRIQLRRKLAISMDWSGAGAIRSMMLGPSDRIPVITGVGIPMSIYSPAARKQNLLLPKVAWQMLPGGAAQMWVPFTPEKLIPLDTPQGGLGD